MEVIEVIMEVISNPNALSVVLFIIGILLIIGIFPLPQKSVYSIPQRKEFIAIMLGIILLIIAGYRLFFLKEPSASPTLSNFQKLPFEAKFTTPKEGDEVSYFLIGKGTFSGRLPERHYLWIVTNPLHSDNDWWPQTRIDSQIGDWEKKIWVGREKEDIGIEYMIAIIMVDEKDNQAYLNYQEETRKKEEWPATKLPGSYIFIDKIKVKRR